MPLKDRDRTRPRRLVRLGIIRLGIMKTSERTGRKYPAQTDHFVLRDAPEIAAVYGEKPRELDVILPFPDIQRNFDAAYTVWAGGVLVCRGDGEFVEYATPHRVERKKKGGQVYTSVYNAPGDTHVANGVAQVAFNWNGEEFKPGDHVPCPGASADLYPHCAACRVSAILKVMMARPDLFRLGYYQIATGSGRNYDTILGTLELILGQAGRVNGIPFKLRLVEEPTVFLANGQRKKTKKWFLQLEPDPEFTRRLYRQQAAAILDTKPEPLALAPGHEDGDGCDYDVADDVAPPPFAEVDAETGEIIEAEEVDDDPPPAQKKRDGGSNGANGKNTRPLDPSQLKAALIAKAGDGKAPITEKQAPFVARKLQECFTDDANPRSCYHSVLRWLWDVGSAKDLAKGQAKATLDWLLDPGGPDDTGDTPLHQHAPDEARRVLRQTMTDQGQMELFDRAEEEAQ